MIQHVDQALEEFLRGRVPLSPAVADISFSTPDRTWGASLNRPTVNCFLWDVARSEGKTSSGTRERVAADGGIVRSMPPVRVDLRYVITAWATDERDEHQVLGQVLYAVLGAPVLPEEYTNDGLRECGTVTFELARSDERRASEFWSALDGQLKPGLSLQVSLDVAAFGWAEAGPRIDVLEVAARAKDEPRPPAATQRSQADEEWKGATRGRKHGAVVLEGPSEP